MEPGIFDMSAEQYHADPCPEPSLSASIANVLLNESPAHARYQHPRLNPRYQPEERELFDLGTAAHAYVLEGSSAFELIDAPDWRTKSAKEQRDAARLAGKVPILTHKWTAIEEMADAIMGQLNVFRDTPKPLNTGKAEQTLVWQEGSVWCRARLDWLSNDRRYVDDLKTVGGSANPEAWGRLVSSNGGDIQASMYIRAVKALTGIEPTFRWVAVENFPPYALSVLSPSPQMLDLARRKVEAAIVAWRTCLETGVWTGYPTRTCYVDTPAWAEAAQMERELREESE